MQKAPVESVHLCDYPTGDTTAIDEELSQRMALVREIVSLGRSARMGAKLKVRQPLTQVEVVLADNTHQAWLEEHAALICDELNVKRVEFTEKAEQYITYTVLPDLKRLGPRLGKRLPALRKLLAEADGGRLLGELETQRPYYVGVARRADHARFRRHPSASSGQGRLGGRPGACGGRGVGHGVDRRVDPRRSRAGFRQGYPRTPQGNWLSIHGSNQRNIRDRICDDTGRGTSVYRLYQI